MLWDESETAPGDVARYRNCTLYLVVQSLQRFWSGKDRFPTTSRRDNPHKDKIYIKGLSLLTDPTTPICIFSSQDARQGVTDAIHR
jgi:hypothetical protein